jgi:FkbM family methyltransferase
MKTVFFQIGTNNGNDNFNQLCKVNKPDCIVLVEPNPAHISNIEKMYRNFTNVHIINRAIFYEDDQEVELFIPAKDGIYGQPGVQPNRKNGNLVYSDGQFSLLPMNDWGEKNNMCSFKASTITFNTICNNLNITDIQYLQIDTEGFDSEIIKMIDLDKINIQQIRYEKWNFDNSCFTEHTKFDKTDTTQLGSAGMDIVKNKLIQHNYILKDIKDRFGNDIMATKNKN